MKAKEYQGREEATHWKSLKTGNLFPFREYANIEIPKRGYLALPLDEYPYTILYEVTKYGKWINDLEKK